MARIPHLIVPTLSRLSPFVHIPFRFCKDLPSVSSLSSRYILPAYALYSSRPDSKAYTPVARVATEFILVKITSHRYQVRYPKFFIKTLL
jgi:hypothetical protein